MSAGLIVGLVMTVLGLGIFIGGSLCEWEHRRDARREVQ